MYGQKDLRGPCPYCMYESTCKYWGYFRMLYGQVARLFSSLSVAVLWRGIVIGSAIPAVPPQVIVVKMPDPLVKEEIAVIFHAALVGRTDVLKNALSMVRSSCSEDDIIALISGGRSEDGATPLHLAAQAGHCDIIRFLLNASADLNVSPTIGTTFLHKRPYDVAVDTAKQAFHVYMFEQIAMGRVESIDRLLKGGVPVTIRDGFKLNESTLHWACSFNNIEVARLLLSSGISVDVVNLEEQTPLHVACLSLNLEMIQLLLSEGASIKSVDINGKKPKDLLPEQSDEIEKLLTFPPTPTMELRDAYLKSEATLAELKAAKEVMAKEEQGPLTPVNGSGQDSFEGTPKEHSSISGISGTISGPSRADGVEIADENEAEVSVICDHKDTPLLVLWPPTQRQIERGQQQPLVLSSLETVLVHIACDGADIFPILNWSGLIDVLERFKLTTQVKRPSKDSIQGDPKIRFSVDNNLCPGRHRFEIEVKSEYVSILASDVTGGLYALYAFIQLLQLHSQLKVYPDGEVALLIFPITLVDWPDVMNRAVMWSFRDRARSSFRVMREMVELLSELRLNMLFLVVGATTIEDAKAQGGGVISGHLDGQNENQNQQVGTQRSTKSPEPSTENEVSLPSHITALDEICENLCVELVPTVVLLSVRERLSLSTLQSFSHTMICLIFKYDLKSVRAELEGERAKEGAADCSVSDGDCEVECIRAFQEVLDGVMVTGFSSIIFSCSKWTARLTNPTVMANRMGLSATQRSLDLLCPSSLYVKPVYFAQEFIKTLRATTLRGVEQGLSMSVLPAFMDSDFTFPTVIIKYYCFLHAGISWNGDAVCDMLQLTDPEFQESEHPIDTSILKEVVSLLLLSKGMATLQSNEMYQAILNMLTGETFFSQSDSPRGKGLSSYPSTDGMALPTDDLSPSSSSLARTERHLWALLTSPVPVGAAVCPSKADAAHLLRHYRKLLTMSKWKAVTAKKGGLLMAFAFGAQKEEEETPFGVELDVFFSSIQILCVLCRAIVLARNTFEKSVRSEEIPDASFGRLMSGLTPGIKSDIANALLAALEHSSLLSKKRFSKVRILEPAAASPTGQSSRPIGATPTPAPFDPLAAARDRYLGQKAPAIPALAVLKTISDMLPLPQTMEDTLLAIFS